jgi:Holliday junction resolvasome RuvABC endonuclease subunit
VTRLVAIDPGKHNVGIAIFQDGVLDVAYLQKTAEVFSALPRGDVVVVEKMQVYRGSIAAPLIDLAIISSEIAGAMKHAWDAEAVYYLPAQWKGQLDKSTCHDRARAALTDAELARIELPKAKKTQLDVMDAVALALAHLRKTGVRMGRSFAR